MTQWLVRAPHLPRPKSSTKSSRVRIPSWWTVAACFLPLLCTFLCQIKATVATMPKKRGIYFVHVSFKIQLVLRLIMVAQYHIIAIMDNPTAGRQDNDQVGFNKKNKGTDLKNPLNTTRSYSRESTCKTWRGWRGNLTMTKAKPGEVRRVITRTRER